MKLVFLVDRLSPKAGGLYDACRALAQELATCDDSITAVGVDEEVNLDTADAWSPVAVRTAPCIGPRALGLAPGLLGILRGLAPDVLHVHGLWTGTSIASRYWQMRTGQPLVIHPHGMLDPWALGNSAWKKRIALTLFERRHLQNASLIRALCKSELASLRALGLTNPVAVVPNGVDLPDLPSNLLPSTGEPKMLLFLGRLHPKKGLVNALRAWAAFRSTEAGRRALTEWRFVVAGWDEGAHKTELKLLCDQLALEWSEDPQPGNPGCQSVCFLGPVFGAAKDALLRSASAFILPSFSEGLPMAVLEAWAYAKPVLMTAACNLPEGFAAGAAIEVQPEPDSIAQGLATLCALPQAERTEMGLAGRRLVETRFTWPAVAAQLAAVNRWLVGKEERPEWVDCPPLAFPIH